MTLPEFDRPPVAETVLAVQFDPLPTLTTAHLGAFWSQLGEDWREVDETPALGQTSEPMGLAPSWLEAGPGLEIETSAPVRLRISRSTRDRMLQVENGWLVYNWRRTSEAQEYARYRTVREEFDAHLARLGEYITASGRGTITPNLWEVAYVNFIPKGALWERVTDWPRILPELLRAGGDEYAPLQTVGGRWVYALAGGRARLQVIVEHGRASEELLVLKLVARGHTSQPTDAALAEGLDLGHEAIVRKFAGITSEEARRYWGYRE